MRTAVFARCELSGSLTAAEHRELARLALRGPRAAEWTAGRLAAHRMLGDVDVMSAPDGAPIVEHGHVSISHDGDWIAVAAGADPVAIDVCGVEHAARVAKILSRLGIEPAAPLHAWTALECALKLRRLGIWTLLDRGVVVGGSCVRGLGAPVHVAWRTEPGYVVAWGHA